MGEIVKAVSILAGGVGIFLIGMAMMTDGLKLAAGPALERILPVRHALAGKPSLPAFS